MPSRYGRSDDDPSLYDTDEVQDDTDLGLAAYAVEQAMPLLAICRGLQVLNTALGGTLVVDMAVGHRHHRHDVEIDDPDNRLGFGVPRIAASCYHHQAIDDVAPNLDVLARSSDGVVEAVAVRSPGWAVGVQWHPEDTFDADPVQLRPLERLVAEARLFAGR